MLTQLSKIHATLAELLVQRAGSGPRQSTGACPSDSRAGPVAAVKGSSLALQPF